MFIVNIKFDNSHSPNGHLLLVIWPIAEKIISNKDAIMEGILILGGRNTLTNIKSRARRMTSKCCFIKANPMI